MRRLPAARTWVPLLACLGGLACGEVTRPDAGLDGPEDAGQADSGPRDGGEADAGQADAGPTTYRLTVGLVGSGAGIIRDDSGAIACPGTCSVDFPSRTRVVLTASAAASSLFGGWSNPGCGSGPTCALTLDGPTTLDARFELRTHLVEVRRSGDGAGRVVSEPVGIDCGVDCTQVWTHGTEVRLTAEAQGNSGFAVWGAGPCEGSAEPVCAWTVDRPVAPEAVFDRDLVTASVQVLGQGSVRSEDGLIDCGPAGAGTCFHGYPAGTLVTLSALPEPGWRFLDWSGACNGSTACALNLSSAANVAARFEQITHRLTVSTSGPGAGRVTSATGNIDCGAICADDVPEGATVTLTAIPGEHYRFAGWSSACSGLTPQCQVVMSQARSVDARFELAPKLAAGYWHACATNEAGALRCWGENARGQLGYGHTDPVGGPGQSTALAEGDVPVGGPVKDIGIGTAHTCVVLTSGDVRCWGQGDSGQLGYGNVADRGGTASTVPSMGGNVPLSGPARAVVAGFAHTCALLESGGVQCWGTNAAGQLGYGDVASVGQDSASVPSAVGQVPVGGPVAQVVAGGLHTCALLGTGAVRCWGSNQSGKLGYGTAPTANVGVGRNNTPVAAGDVPIGGPVARLSATGAHTCAMLVAGGVRCWGLGLDGRLGYGNENDVGHSGLTPAVAGDVGLGVGLVTIHAGQTQTCAIFTGPALKCWGDGVRGALGYGDPEDLGDEPGELGQGLAAVNIGGDVDQVAPGGFFTCARLTTGVIRCWGEGGLGGLGNGLQSWTGVASGAPAVPVF